MEDAIGRTLFEVFGDSDQSTRAAEVYLDVIRTGSPRSFINEFVINDRKIFFEIQVFLERTVFPCSVGTSPSAKRMELNLER